MTVPFDTLSSIATPQAGPDGAWHGRLALSCSDPAASFEATEELLGYLERLCATGALSIDADHMHDSRLDIDIVCKGPSLDAGFSARHLHPAAWRVLLQMLAHCHAIEPYDTAVWVDGLVAMARPAESAPKPALQQAYPQVLQASMLEIGSDVRQLDDSLSLAVTCERKLSKGDLDKLSSLVDDWGSLVYVGGFTPITVPIDAPLLNKPRIVRQGPNAFDVSINSWSPNADALAVLVNLLIALKTALSIGSIKLE